MNRMVSKRQKIVAVLVVVVVALAGGGVVLLNQQPHDYRTPAQKIALAPGDAGLDGYGNLIDRRPFWPPYADPANPIPPPNMTSGIDRFMLNDTVYLYNGVLVFNTTNDCKAYFESFRSSRNGTTPQNISLGDEGFYMNDSVPGVYQSHDFVFTRANVFADVTASTTQPNCPWLHNAAHALALQELEKIDANLPV